MKKPSRQAQVNKADKLFSLIVRASGRCVNCGSTYYLQCAHGWSRKHRPIRWDRRNAFCLCRACHVYYTHRPADWQAWLRREWGEDLYWTMNDLARSTDKVDLDAIVADLGERWTQIQAAA